jgi:hypothetical protein
MHEQNFYGACPFSCCGNLGLRMPAEEVGISSTMFSVRRLCVAGPVCNRMSFHSIYLSMSILPRPCLPLTLILFDVYTQRVHRSSCPIYLRGCPSCCIWGACLSYLVGADTSKSCHAGVEEWTNKFQLDPEVRNIYQDCKFFPSRHHIIVLRWRVLCFHCSCMMISDIASSWIDFLLLFS